jgi:hypothetical protein
MDDTELIAQLRTDPTLDGTTLGNEAADAPEALQAELHKQTAAKDAATRLWSEAGESLQAKQPSQARELSDNRCIRELMEYCRSNQGAYIFLRLDATRVMKYLAAIPDTSHKDPCNVAL